MAEIIMYLLIAAASIFVTVLIMLVSNIKDQRDICKGDIIFEDESFYLAITEKDLDEIQYGHEDYITLKVIRKKY